MLSPATMKVLRQPIRVLYIIWLAFLASHFVYVMIAVFVSRTPRSPVEDEFVPYFQIGAVILAGVSIVAATVYERIYLSEERLRQRLNSMGVPEEAFTSSGSGSSMAVPRGFDELSETEQKVVALLPYYQTSMIVRWAFLESITIYGLIAFFTGALELRWFLAFPLVSFLLLATTRPNVASVLEKVSRYAR